MQKSDDRVFLCSINIKITSISIVFKDSKSLVRTTTVDYEIRSSRCCPLRGWLRIEFALFQYLLPKSLPSHYELILIQISLESAQPVGIGNRFTITVVNQFANLPTTIEID